MVDTDKYWLMLHDLDPLLDISGMQLVAGQPEAYFYLTPFSWF
jgi:hypothetical protein